MARLTGKPLQGIVPNVRFIALNVSCFQGINQNSLLYRSMFVYNETNITPVSSNTWSGLAYESPSTNAVANSRALATLAAVMTNKGAFNHVRLLNESTWEDAMGGIVTKFDNGK